MLAHVLVLFSLHSKQLKVSISVFRNSIDFYYSIYLPFKFFLFLCFILLCSRQAYLLVFLASISHHAQIDQFCCSTPSVITNIPPRSQVSKLITCKKKVSKLMHFIYGPTQLNYYIIIC